LGSCWDPGYVLILEASHHDRHGSLSPESLINGILDIAPSPRVSLVCTRLLGTSAGPLLIP
jgi:hypothetical protein